MLYSSYSNECAHEVVLGQQMKLTLGILLIILGLLSSAANIWLVSSLFLRAEMISYIHLRLLNLSVACFGRGLLAGYPFQGTSAITGRWLFGESCCKLFAFLHQFFSVSEIISLMLLARECLFLIRPSYIGTCKNYISSTITSWLLSLFWATLPLFNVGSYTCSATNFSCDLNWAYQSKQEFFYIVSYSIFMIGLPLLYTIWNVFQAYSLSSVNFNFSAQEMQNSMKAVMAVSLLMFLTWVPKGMLSTFSFLGIEFSERLVFITSISTEFSGLCPVLSFLCFDKRIRNIFLGKYFAEDNFQTKSIVKNRRFEAEL